MRERVVDRSSVDQRSPSTDHMAAWEVTTGSTCVVVVAEVDGALAAFWLSTICTAREATMKAPTKPAATVRGLRWTWLVVLKVIERMSEDIHYGYKVYSLLLKALKCCRFDVLAP